MINPLGSARTNKRKSSPWRQFVRMDSIAQLVEEYPETFGMPGCDFLIRAFTRLRLAEPAG
jgi:hypothetical protein